MLNRRRLLQGIGAGALATGAPRLSFAGATTDNRFVLVILRGAADGLALVPPYGEGRYAALRGELALAGVLKLDGLFGLHPSLVATHALYRQREALVVHAVASPYRARSHFDGQDVLENGAQRAGDARDGWLNRALAPLGGRRGDEAAIALAQTTPLVLRGDNSVTSWAPSRLPGADEATLRRIEMLYAEDEFFRTRLAQALESQAIADDVGGMAGRRRRGDQAFKDTLAQAAKFLTAPNGPRIAVVESGSWDTHANQGAASGTLARKFKALDEGLSALHAGMGDAWRDTVVAVVTEFGRTVKINGTRGTDHGTGTAALLLGGAVRGGQVVADWPGLADRDLYQGRDLYPTTDLRAVFKDILVAHLAVPEAFAEREVFPGVADTLPIPLVRRS